MSPALTSMPNPRQSLEAALAWVISHHYGDGSVYLPAGTPLDLISSCLERGLIGAEGCVTRKGRELLQRYSA